MPTQTPDDLREAVPAPATDPPADPFVALPPGATIGILGGGQLGRMLALAARPMGFRIAILDPDPDCPAAGLADTFVRGAYDDAAAALELAGISDVVTYELEHIGASMVEAVAARLPVRPGLAALRATQDRLAERRFVDAAGEATAPWREVRDLRDLVAAVTELGYPLRLKAAIGGYDGRGQHRLAAPADLEPAFVALGAGAAPLLVERELDFDLELSAIAARDGHGRVATFPPAHNRHDRGILIESVVPAPVPPAVDAAARAIATRLATALDVVGTLTVELFLLNGRDLVVNELAPRVHNSGHWTIEGAPTSQFEQHVRAICGLPFGASEARSPAAMVNLLGDGAPRPARLLGLEAALADPAVRVHVYDKRRVFERRKMGHVTAIAATPAGALERARAARSMLHWATE